MDPFSSVASLVTSGLWSVVIIVIVAVLYYRRSNLPRPLWERCDIYSHPELSFSETLRVAFGRRPVHEIDVERRRRCGDIYGVREGSLDMLTISELDILQLAFNEDFWTFSDRKVFKGGDPIYDSMLSELNGEEWKRFRGIVGAAFSDERVEKMTPLIHSTVYVLVQNLIKQGGKPTDAKIHFDSFALDAIALIAFGLNLNSYKNPKQEFILHAKKVFGQTFSWRFLLHVLVPKIANFLGISFVDSSASKFFKKMVNNEIQSRKSAKKGKEDFLQVLINRERHIARKKREAKKKGEQSFEEAKLRSPDFKATKELKPITRDEMVAQCVMFFAVGFASMSSTLALLSYELATHSEIQERLRREIDAAFFAHGQFTYDAVENMPYLNQVISETLRKYPPIIRIMRKTRENYELLDTGYTAYKGTLITIPIYAIHHHPRLYPDPATFNPERFTPEEIGERHPIAFMPFGHAFRNCGGRKLALIEAKMCIANVLSQFVIKTCPKTKVPELHTGYGLLIPKRIMLIFEKRQNKKSK